MLCSEKSENMCIFLRFHAQGDQSGPSLRCYDKHLWVWKGLLPKDEPWPRVTGILKAACGVLGVSQWHGIVHSSTCIHYISGQSLLRQKLEEQPGLDLRRGFAHTSNLLSWNISTDCDETWDAHTSLNLITSLNNQPGYWQMLFDHRLYVCWLFEGTFYWYLKRRTFFSKLKGKDL